MFFQVFCSIFIDLNRHLSQLKIDTSIYVKIDLLQNPK